MLKISLFIFLLSLSWELIFSMPAKAQTCRALYAGWMDWLTCIGCPLGFGGSSDWAKHPGLPSVSHDSIGDSWIERRQNGNYLHGTYAASDPLVVSGDEELYFIIWSSSLSYPKGSPVPPAPKFKYHPLAFVSSTCPEDNLDDDNGGDDDDDDDDDECPNLNVTIRGTLLPARRGTARVSGDWCE